MILDTGCTKAMFGTCFCYCYCDPRGVRIPQFFTVDLVVNMVQTGNSLDGFPHSLGKPCTIKSS